MDGHLLRIRGGVLWWGVLLGLSAATLPCRAQENSVSVRVELVKSPADTRSGPVGTDASNVVVWLTPADNSSGAFAANSQPTQVPRLIQHNKSFEPHVLVVEVGTVVQFPNKDPFFHNIFSLYDGKRFDLGLYEAGSTRSVRFDRPGVSFLFCNIHAEMSAVVVTVDTHYFGVSDHSGLVRIHNVPDGRYQIHVWYERSLPENLQALSRSVTISQGTRALAPVRVLLDPNFTLAHKNKYGQDYVPPPNPGYLQP
jgi:plastocyanin